MRGDRRGPSPWWAVAWTAALALALLAGTSRAATPAPRLVVQTGQAFTTVAAWSPDGTRVASGGGDGRVVLWDAGSGRQLHAMGVPAGAITALRFSHDGSTLLAGTSLGTLHAWDAASGAPGAASSVGASPVEALEFAAGRRVLMAALQEGHAVVVDMAGGTPAVLRTAPYGLHHAALSPDGRRVAVARGPRAGLVVFDVASSQPVFETPRSAVDIHQLRFSPDGGVLAVGDDEAIRLLDARDGRLLRTIEGHGHAVDSLEFSSDGRRLLSAGVTVRLWDVATGTAVAPGFATREYVVQATLSPQGDRVLAVDRAGMGIWSVRSGASVQDLRGYAHPVRGVHFSPDGGRLLVDTGVWDLATGRSTSTPLLGGPDRYAQWSGDGSRVLGVGPRGPTLWDAANWAEARSFDTADATVLHAALSPDGRRVAAGLASGAIRLWDARDGSPERELRRGDRPVRSVAFSPDGRLLLSGGGDQPVVVWRLDSGREAWSAGGTWPTLAAFSPDGAAVALVEGTGRVAVRNAVDGVPRGAGIDHGATVTAIAYSRDGRWIATGGVDRRVKLWDASTGRLAQTFSGHDDGINALAFAPDGRVLASTAGDGTARLWRVDAGDAIAVLVQLVDRSRWTANGLVVGMDGRFDAPDLESLKGLHWILPDAPLRPVPVEAFMRDYYEPRLLPRLLAGDALPPVVPVADRDLRAPSVEIVAVHDDPRDPRRAEVEVTVAVPPAADRAGRPVTAADLRLFRDGQLAAYVDGPVALDRTGKARLRLPVRLHDPGARGAVRLSAYAFNGDGIKSETTSRLHARERAVAPVRRRAVVVSIGVDVYQSPAWDLGFAASDARLIGQALGERLRASGSFDEVVQITLVSDADTPEGASKAAIRAALAGLAAPRDGRAPSGPAAGPDDVVFVSFSGHGAVDRAGTFHLVPHDIGDVASRLLTPAILERSISTDELGEWLRDIDAGELALILDACHSAASIAQPGFKPGPMGSRGLGQLAFDKGIRILAATQPADVALESEATQHGLLSYALVKDGIEQGLADFRPRDGALWLGEWFEYGVERVPALAREVQDGAVATRGAAVRVRNAGTRDATGNRGLQQPSLFDFRPQARKDEDVRIATP